MLSFSGGKLLHRCLTLQTRIYFTSVEIVCTIYFTDGKLECDTEPQTALEYC